MERSISVLRTLIAQDTVVGYLCIFLSNVHYNNVNIGVIKYSLPAGCCDVGVNR